MQIAMRSTAAVSARRKTDACSKRRRQSVASMVVVIALHTTALYALMHAQTEQPPTVSAPLTVSLIAGEALKPVPIRKPATQPKSAPPKPALSTTSTTRPKPERQETAAESQATNVAAVEPALSARITQPRFDAEYLNNPAPVYPRLSRQMREEGRVWLRVFVSPDGSPREVSLQASSGSPRLDRAAQDAVERWKFLPARQGTQSVGAWVVVPVNFSLSQKS